MRMHAVPNVTVSSYKLPLVSTRVEFVKPRVFPHRRNSSQELVGKAVGVNCCIISEWVIRFPVVME